MPKNLVVVLSAAALALTVAACGSASSSSTSSAAPAAAPFSSSTAAASSSSAPSAPASGRLAIAANPTGALMFSKTSLTAKAGTVTITFTNQAPEGHNFTVQTAGGQTVGATPTFNGGSKTLTLKLKPGTYTFLCTVPGHEMGGMKGTLKVT